MIPNSPYCAAVRLQLGAHSNELGSVITSQGLSFPFSRVTYIEFKQHYTAEERAAQKSRAPMAAFVSLFKVVGHLFLTIGTLPEACKGKFSNCKIQAYCTCLSLQEFAGELLSLIHDVGAFIAQKARFEKGCCFHIAAQQKRAPDPLQQQGEVPPPDATSVSGSDDEEERALEKILATEKTGEEEVDPALVDEQNGPPPPASPILDEVPTSPTNTVSPAETNSPVEITTEELRRQFPEAGDLEANRVELAQLIRAQCRVKTAMLALVKACDPYHLALLPDQVFERLGIRNLTLEQLTHMLPEKGSDPEVNRRRLSLLLSGLSSFNIRLLPLHCMPLLDAKKHIPLIDLATLTPSHLQALCPVSDDKEVESRERFAYLMRERHGEINEVMKHFEQPKQIMLLSSKDLRHVTITNLTAEHLPHLFPGKKLDSDQQKMTDLLDQRHVRTKALLPLLTAHYSYMHEDTTAKQGNYFVLLSAEHLSGWNVASTKAYCRPLLEGCDAVERQRLIQCLLNGRTQEYEKQLINALATAGFTVTPPAPTERAPSPPVDESQDGPQIQAPTPTGPKKRRFWPKQ